MNILASTRTVSQDAVKAFKGCDLYKSTTAKMHQLARRNSPVGVAIAIWAIAEVIGTLQELHLANLVMNWLLAGAIFITVVVISPAKSKRGQPIRRRHGVEAVFLLSCYLFFGFGYSWVRSAVTREHQHAAVRAHLESKRVIGEQINLSIARSYHFDSRIRPLNTALPHSVPAE